MAGLIEVPLRSGQALSPLGPVRGDRLGVRLTHRRPCRPNRHLTRGFEDRESNGRIARDLGAKPRSDRAPGEERTAPRGP